MAGRNGHSCLLCRLIVPAFEMQGVQGLLQFCHLRQNGFPLLETQLELVIYGAVTLHGHNVFDFSLTDEGMVAIAALDTATNLFSSTMTPTWWSGSSKWWGTQNQARQRQGKEEWVTQIKSRKYAPLRRTYATVSNAENRVLASQKTFCYDISN